MAVRCYLLRYVYAFTHITLNTCTYFSFVFFLIKEQYYILRCLQAPLVSELDVLIYIGSGYFPWKIFFGTYILFYLELGEYIEARQNQEPLWAETVWELPEWSTTCSSGRCMWWTLLVAYSEFFPQFFFPRIPVLFRLLFKTLSKFY